jgi:hypothetical protein
MNIVRRYWAGEGPLWKIYWLYGVAVSLALTGFFAAAGLLHWVALPGLVAMLAGLALYTVWIVVSIWRCAENVEGRPFDVDPELWTWLARWLTVAWAINVAALSILLIQMSAFD